MEVDLFREGVDLLDFYRGKLSLRRLLVFSHALPVESSLMKELAHREYGDQILWDSKDYLAAAQANAARELLFFQSLCRWLDGDPRKRGEKPVAPEPIRHPGWTAPKPVMATLDDFAAFATTIQKG